MKERPLVIGLLPQRRASRRAAEREFVFIALLVMRHMTEFMEFMEFMHFDHDLMTVSALCRRIA